MKVNSCYNCKERSIYCHADCEKYKKYLEELDVIKSNRKQYLDGIAILTHRLKMRRRAY